MHVKMVKIAGLGPLLEDEGEKSARDWKAHFRSSVGKFAVFMRSIWCNAPAMRLCTARRHICTAARGKAVLMLWHSQDAILQLEVAKRNVTAARKVVSYQSA